MLLSQFINLLRSFLLIFACVLTQFCVSETVTEPTDRENVKTSTTPNAPVEEVVEKKPPLFLLNKKETIQVSGCSCRAILLNNEDRNIAGKLANLFTKEADRSFKLSCKGTVNNKTKFKLSHMKVVFHLLSETEYPLYDSQPVEYLNNYILPNKKGTFEIDVLYESGLSLFMKKVKKVGCEIKSVNETQSGEVVDE